MNFIFIDDFYFSFSRILFTFTYMVAILNVSRFKIEVIML